VSSIQKREAAKRDLTEQFIWYAENAGIEVAERFLSAVDATLAQVSQMPRIGSPIHPRSHELAGLRRWPVEGFERILLFYIPEPGKIDLVRVLHAKRNWDSLFRRRN
jgi:toxin ParE1/3/4